MLKKLRLRFVCVLMALVTGMLGILFGFLYRNTQIALEAQCLSMMQDVAKNPLQLGHPGNRTDAVRLPYFVIKISARGEMLTVSGDSFDLSDRVFLDGLVERVLDTEDTHGLLREYGLRFLKVTSTASLSLVFADTTNETATLHAFARMYLLGGGLFLTVFLGIAILLARWMVKPAERSFTEQRQFVSDASHELKTPLTVILTNAELLLAPDTEPQTRVVCAESILTMSHQMRALVEELLELARSDTGRAQMLPEALDYSALVEDGLLPFEAAFYESGLILESDIAPGLSLTGSRRHLSQVLDILLDNARKYATSGTVEVALAPWGKHRCRLSVSNECQQLSQQELRKLFKRFYRRDPARSRDGSFGLGLSIAEGIVTAHKGKIWAGWENGRVTFTVELPTKL